MNRGQIGKMYVSEHLVLSECFADALAKIRFVPVRVEMLYERMAFEYIGHSPAFRELAKGEIIPEYELNISTLAGGIVNIEIVEQGVKS